VGGAVLFVFSYAFVFLMVRKRVSYYTSRANTLNTERSINYLRIALLCFGELLVWRNARAAAGGVCARRVCALSRLPG
jgi:hypothetical protein